MNKPSEISPGSSIVKWEETSLKEEKIYHILFGIRGMDESDMDKLVEELEKNGVKVGKTAFRYKKMGITKFLADNPDCNAVILSEYLEEKSPYCEQDFEYLADMYEEVMLIPILQNNCNGDGLAASLYSLGIFTGIYDADANFENMASILLNGRSRKDAKAYYEIREQSASHHSVDYRSTVSYLENSRGQELEEMVEHVLGIVNDDEFATILKMLDRETYEEIKKLGCRDIMPFFMKEDENRMENGKFPKTAEKIRNKIGRKRKAAAGAILLFALLFVLGVAKCVVEERSAENQGDMHIKESKAVALKLWTSFPMPARMPSASPKAKDSEHAQRTRKPEETPKEGRASKRRKPAKTRRPSNANKKSKVRRKAQGQTARPVISHAPASERKHLLKRARRKASRRKSSEKVKRNDENIVGIN